MPNCHNPCELPLLRNNPVSRTGMPPWGTAVSGVFTSPDDTAPPRAAGMPADDLNS
jgi:hypothetical protein